MISHKHTQRDSETERVADGQSWESDDDDDQDSKLQQISEKDRSKL